ncbi:DUF4160 domain-containing protein [Limibaculum sp. FT325]|uniref:DUF4160 domain-containing protein n=1 Tax=Thermohalobaculum sediminis TaxID=2939436 RepID=UPI0020C0E090|nr:DUF4160 domain-containing protein [Limibaculum sediminis]MCL5779201.1 DUF4160 domain-containing protein [Limibaculum sediminis]
MAQSEIDFAEEAEALQDSLALIDLLSHPSSSNAATLVIKKLERLRVRMDGTKNHGRPHVHIDYGKQLHFASYAIDTGERLAGNLKTAYDKTVREWINKNRQKLVVAWEAIQGGTIPENTLAELKAG